MPNRLILALRINRDTQNRNVRLNDIDFERNFNEVIEQVFRNHCDLCEFFANYDLSLLVFFCAGRRVNKTKTFKSNGLVNGSILYVISKEIFSPPKKEAAEEEEEEEGNDQTETCDPESEQILPLSLISKQKGTVIKIGKSTKYRIRTIESNLVAEKLVSLSHHFDCPKFRMQFIEVLTQTKIADKVIKHYMNLKSDPIALSLLTDPEILVNLFEARKCFTMNKEHPLFGAPAISIVLAVLHAIENEQNEEYSTTQSPFSYSLLSLSDEEYSDDEQAESLNGESENQFEENETANSSSAPITNEMLEAALPGALFSEDDDLFTSTDDNTSMPPSQTNPFPSQYVNDLEDNDMDISITPPFVPSPLNERIPFEISEPSEISEYSENVTNSSLNATQATSSGTVTATSVSSTPPAQERLSSEATGPSWPYENQLRQLRDLGFTNFNQMEIVLDIVQGNLQSAIDILLADSQLDDE